MSWQKCKVRHLPEPWLRRQLRGRGKRRWQLKRRLKTSPHKPIRNSMCEVAMESGWLNCCWYRDRDLHPLMISISVKGICSEISGCSAASTSRGFVGMESEPFKTWSWSSHPLLGFYPSLLLLFDHIY